MSIRSVASALSARCHCGAVTLVSDHPAKSVVHCHCGQCRRLSGSAFTTWVSVPNTSIRVDGGEKLTAFDATDNITRHFCKVCGSHVFTADKRYPHIVGVPAGAVEGQSLPAPRAHCFVSHKASWHTIDDGLPQSGVELLEGERAPSVRTTGV